MPNKDFTKLDLSFNVLGEEREEFISFLETYGIDESRINDSASVIILTDRTKKVFGKKNRIAYPYFKRYDKSKIQCSRLMTYALEENRADVVGKNVRYKNDFTAFELLSDYGIGRIYLHGTQRNNPKYALAFACGLMLSGIDFRTTVELIGCK